MPPLDPYLSPQAQQAVIAGLFIAAGWWVVAFQNSHRDSRNRRDRVNDIQRALLAEIRAHVVSLEQQISEGGAEDLLDRMRAGNYLPVLPSGANDRIYRAIISEIHLLPAHAIDPVVIYYRLLSVMDSLAGSIRSTARRMPERAAEMFEDYLALNIEALETGLDALEILAASLQGGEAAVMELIEREKQREANRIAANLPGELAEMRQRLSRRSSDRSGL